MLVIGRAVNAAADPAAAAEDLLADLCLSRLTPRGRRAVSAARLRRLRPASPQVAALTGAAGRSELHRSTRLAHAQASCSLAEQRQAALEKAAAARRVRAD